MRIVRFSYAGRAHYGILKDETIQPIQGTPFSAIKPAGAPVSLNEVRLLAPSVPSKIVAIGVNYKSHAIEFKHDLPPQPLIFLKPSTAIINPGEDIVYPPSAHQVDYEAELGLVIKKKAHMIRQDEASGYIFGYTCFNDVTARDLQKVDGQWTRAKGFDTFAPFGPWIETELDPTNLTVESFLNGALKQHNNTNNLIFSVPFLVSFVSQVMTLMPGDIIATGTPSGVGPMQPGDRVEVRIEGIGTLQNRIAGFEPE
jgi:2-keto-4-pentenoate hydratase/2-oxohepta-3-ene-1,7-dioic acid hydratase in catechol pathway